MKTLALVFLAAFLAAAQTSTDPGPSYCLGGSHYPPSSPYSFQCVSSGSIVFPPGQFAAHFQFTGSLTELWTTAFTPMPGNPWGHIMAVNSFTAPDGCPYSPGVRCSTDGYLSFTFDQPGSDGVLHTGSFSATVNGERDWRGWFHPILTDITLVVN